MHLKIKPIGVIKKSSSGVSDILIYSEFERVLCSIMEKFEKGTNLLIVHKSHMSLDGHQVQISDAELITRKGNLLTVRGIEADDDPLIDVRLKK
ncbi:Uncharacterised protein [uncultured archaeon]|nr:Uncharacterised protein [uncultured archaeon]